MTQIKQKIQLSKAIKVMTIVVLIVIIGAIGILIHTATLPNTQQFKPLFAIIIGVIILAIAISLAFAPRLIELTETEIIIHRNIGNKTIYLKDVNSLEPYDPKSLDIRVFGSGGFFGSFGIFRNADYGFYTAYVGDYKDAFYIILNTGKACLVSCENRDEMMRGITAIISKTNH